MHTRFCNPKNIATLQTSILGPYNNPCSLRNSNLYFVLRNAWPDVFYAEWDRRRTCDSICTYIFARECECFDDVIGYAQS